MNLLLLDPGELGDGGVVELRGERARHVAGVLRARPGDTLRAGVADGPVGTAEVVELDADRAVLRCALGEPAPPRGEDALLLAIPRPVVARRCVEHATALGFGCIVLFRSRHVDKSHMLSSALQPERLAAAVRAGLEQSRRTMRPAVRVFPRFRPFVEDVLDGLVPAQRFVADPEATTPTAALRLAPAPFTLAIGPERGLVPFELESLAARGFTAVHAGRAPLRVETAVAALHGRLAVLRELAAAR